MQPTSTQPRDFSGKSERVTFTADGDTFYALPRVPTKLFSGLIVKIQAAKEMDERVDAVLEFFTVCLFDESLELMNKRLVSKNNPIDVGQAMDIIAYLTEVYGGRPTQPSSNSSDGSTTGETGSTSTDGQPNTALIPLSSPLIVS